MEMPQAVNAMCAMSPAVSNLDPTYVRAQIELLRIRNPEIWEDDDTVLLALESETNLFELLSRAVAHMQDAQAIADGLSNLIADLKIRRDRRLDRIDALRSLMQKLMYTAGTQRIELLRATLSIRAGQPKVIITDEAALPDRLCRIKREPDKKLIREHLESGTVEGATLSNSEPVLTVRVK
jgi:hypothetical protein